MATILPIGIGSVPNDGAGDTIRDAFDKCNQNFDELNSEKQDTLTLTTTGTSGSATLVGATLNIPNYATIPSLTSGSVLFSNGTTIAQDNANLYWNDFANRLGIGTSTPAYRLDVNGTGRISSDLLTNGRFGAGSGVNTNCRIFASAFSGELATAIFTTFNSSQSTQEAVRFSTADFVSGAVRIFPRVASGAYNAVTVSDSAVIVNMTNKPLLVGVQDGSVIQFTTNDVIIGTNNSEKARITSSGNLGIGTSNPSALLDVNGDALINGITVGRGSGNVAGNTIVGEGSFGNNTSGSSNTIIGNTAATSLTTGSYNVIIGAGAGINLGNGSGNTIIGNNNYYPPSNLPVDYSNTLSISKNNGSFGGNLPHIWAPATVSTDGYETVLSVDPAAYRAMFVEYVLEDISNNIRAGYIKAIWSGDLTQIEFTEENTSSIGNTTPYTFDVLVNDGKIVLEVTASNSTTVYCNVSSRLLARST